MRHCKICKKPLHKRNESGYCTGKCYYKSPIYKKYQAEYQRKRYPEYKPRIKAYNKRPEVKERQKKYMHKYMPIYNKLERVRKVKALWEKNNRKYLNKYNREYRRRKKNEGEKT